MHNLPLHSGGKESADQSGISLELAGNCDSWHGNKQCRTSATHVTDRDSTSLKFEFLGGPPPGSFSLRARPNLSTNLVTPLPGPAETKTAERNVCSLT